MNTENWISRIDETTNLFFENFQKLSVDELNWKPDDKTWSIAQNIHHLIVINQTYYPIIIQVKENIYHLPWIGKFDFMVRFFGNFILKSVSPDRQNKMKTFAKWEPSTSKIEADILEKFKVHQSELKVMIASSTDLLDKDAVISSPANKNIVYSLKSAFDIIVTHELRHLEQAKEVNEWRMKKI